MKRIIILGCIIIVVVAGFLFFYKNNNKNDVISKNIISNPWIEITSGNVEKLKDDQKTIEKKLSTGDELVENSIIKSDNTGKAVIHFSDGSVLRLDSNSIIQLNQGSFNENTGSLKVNVSLFIGRVWSKIIGLTTADSVWQVKTGNTVATVRGTAFGMEVDKNNQTKVIGSEHTVSIDIISKDKNKIHTTLTVSPNEILEINDKIATKISALASISTSTGQSTSTAEVKSLENIVSVKKADQAVLVDKWFRDNGSADKNLIEKINNLKKNGFNDKSLRQELNRESKIEIQNKINTINSEVSGASTDLKTPNILPDSTKTTITATNTVLLRGSTIEIKTEATSLDFTEGDKIKFEAVLLAPDQTKKVITNDVEWSVVGEIGHFISPGVLLSEIGKDYTEAGSASGGVLAKYKYSSGEITGHSGLININAKPPILLDNSGQ